MIVVGIKYKVLRQSLPTTLGGTVDFTSAGFGIVKAAIAIFCECSVNGLRRNAGSFGVGFWDGTNQAAVGILAKHNRATSSTFRHSSVTRGAIKPGNNATEYTFSAITDGVRLTLDVDNTGLSRLCTVSLFGGDDVTGVVGDFVAHATQNSTTTEAHGLGVTPDVVFFISIGHSSTGASADAVISFGVCFKDSSGHLAQRTTLWRSNDAQATSEVVARLETDSAVGQLGSAGLDWTGEITVLDGTNIECTTRDAGSGSDIVYYLALDLAGAGVVIRTLTTPTSTGDDVLASIGFQPSLQIVSLTKAAAVDTTYVDDADANANSLQVGAADGTNQFSSCAVDEDAKDTTKTFSVANNKLIDLDDSVAGTAANFIDATLSSFDADGRTLNYSVVDGTSRQGWELLLGTQVAPVSLPLSQRQRLIRQLLARSR